MLGSLNLEFTVLIYLGLATQFVIRLVFEALIRMILADWPLLCSAGWALFGSSNCDVGVGPVMCVVDLGFLREFAWG